MAAYASLSLSISKTHDARADFDKLLTREETSHEQVPLMLPPSPKVVSNTSSGRKFARLPAGGRRIRTIGPARERKRICRGTDRSNPFSSSGESTSRGILPSHGKKPAFRAGVRARQCTAVSRDGYRAVHGADRREYLCRAKFQYRGVDEAVA